jgi:hypothetical protein
VKRCEAQPAAYHMVIRQHIILCKTLANYLQATIGLHPEPFPPAHLVV